MIEYKVRLHEDYKELWGNSSEWYNETNLLNNEKSVEHSKWNNRITDLCYLLKSGLNCYLCFLVRLAFELPCRMKWKDLAHFSETML